MPLDFPNTPTDGQIFNGAGVSWRWDGTKWTSVLSTGVLRESIVNVLDHGAKGDGVTDDTAAIQSVLNTYAGKAIVFMPASTGSYMVTGLLVPSGTHLILEGVIKLKPDASGGVVNLSGVTNVIISGFGTIDGNAVAQATHPSGMPGLGIDNSSNIRVSGITLKNAYHWPLNVTQSHDVVVEGVNMIGGSAANEFAAGTYDCWLMNCDIDGTGNGDYAFCFYGGVHDSGAIGNTIRNAGAGTSGGPPGIGVLSDAAQPAQCRSIVISDNIIHDCAASGIVVLGQSAGPVIQTGIVISNNRCYSNGKSAPVAGLIADCYLSWATNVTVSGNQFSGFGSASYSGNGVYLSSATSYIVVTGNQIYNNGQGTTNGSGLWCDHANYIAVTNNYFYDNQTTVTMLSSITGDAGTQNIFTGNYLGRPFLLNQAADTVYANGEINAWKIGQNTRLVANKINFAGLPTSATGLVAGDVWRNGTVLNVV